MPKRAERVERPDILLDQSLAAPLYRQLYERLRGQILSGQLEPDARLPSTRAMASALGVSRNTTALAYDMLQMEGYIESRVGDGARVAHLQPEQTLQPVQLRGSQAQIRAGAHTPTLLPTLSQRGQRIANLPHPSQQQAEQGLSARDLFRAGEPDVSLFPFTTWSALLAKHTRHSLAALARPQPAQGYPPLREAIAAHIGVTRGVRCAPEQIIITAGAQGAFDLLARTLLDPGDVAWVEEPGYFGSRGALLAAGARLCPVPIDAEGLDVAAGRRLAPDARLAVVTPSHQFPAGVTMSLTRRLRLLEWAREARAWIVEDDYDSEFRYGGRPLEALQGLDRAGLTLYVGTFSKTLFPALRLGYLIAPPTLVDGLLAARHYIDAHMPMLEQMALAEFIAEGGFVRHLRRTRMVYLERRDALLAALAEHVGGQLDVVAPEAGIHLAAWLPAGVAAPDVARRAAEAGVRITPITGSSERPLPREGLLLGFACATPDELRAGVRLLAGALRRS